MSEFRVASGPRFLEILDLHACQFGTAEDFREALLKKITKIRKWPIVGTKGHDLSEIELYQGDILRKVFSSNV